MIKRALILFFTIGGLCAIPFTCYRAIDTQKTIVSGFEILLESISQPEEETPELPREFPAFTHASETGKGDEIQEEYLFEEDTTDNSTIRVDEESDSLLSAAAPSVEDGEVVFFAENIGREDTISYSTTVGEDADNDDNGSVKDEEETTFITITSEGTIEKLDDQEPLLSATSLSSESEVIEETSSVEEGLAASAETEDADEEDIPPSGEAEEEVIDDNEPPIVGISRPTYDEIITEVTDITGIVRDDDLVDFSLQYAYGGKESDPNEYVLINSGDYTVLNDTLGIVNPFAMKNGSYTLYLTGTDTAGQESWAGTTYIVDTGVKAGNFTFSEQDVYPSLPDFPLAITRTYDSVNREQGDFGISWKMDMFDLDIQEDINRHVTLDLPNGRRTTFLFRFEETADPFIMRAVWDSQDEISAALEMSGNNEVFISPETSTVLGFVQNLYIPYEEYKIQEYLLTLSDGTRYYLTREAISCASSYDNCNDDPLWWSAPEYGPLSLSQIEYPNGDFIVIQKNSIFHSSGEAIYFYRDKQNRITDILDTNGNVISYGYDERGDLVQVIDQEQYLTEYFYDDDHHLLQVVDPSGVTTVTNRYDDTGRLVYSVNEEETVIEYSYGIDSWEKTVTKKNGEVTIFQYDESGTELFD